MKVLNKHGFPWIIEQAISGHKHVRAEVDYTATELAKPALMLRLERDHEKDIEIDVVDGLRALYGTALHKVMAEAAKGYTSLMAEEKCSAQCGKWLVGGTPDLFDKALCTLYDYKFTSVYSTMFGEIDGAKPDWVLQLNCYAYVLRKNVHRVDSAEIIAFYSDWREKKTQESDNYPKLPIGRVPVRLFPVDKVEESLAKRCQQRDEAMRVPVASIPQCSAADRWEKPTKYAVYLKANQAKALRVLDSIEEATEYIKAKRLTGTEVKIREGESVRCKSYCAVKRWCPYWNSATKGGL